LLIRSAREQILSDPEFLAAWLLTICGLNDMPGVWGFSVTRASGALNNIFGSPWRSANSDGSFTDGLAITP